MSTAALPIGCASLGIGSRPAPNAALRAPAVGQSWRYAKNDLFSGAFIDNQIDTVAGMNHIISIDSRSETGHAPNAPKPSWGMDWLSKYVGNEHAPTGPLANEIQEPWGMVLVDPHWAQVQVYEAPIPLWPSELQVGWKQHIVTKYKTPNVSDGLLWDQSMRAVGWESVTVPAGKFTALRYTNTIHFTSGDGGRRDSMRNETLWFAPEVGRWVVRESQGSYYLDESVDDRPFNESSYRWELLAWT